MAETKLHHQPLMSDAKDHFGLLSDPFLLIVFSMVADDGIRMLDPSTSRTLRIYPLETITRWDLKEMGGNDTIGRSRGKTDAGKSSEQQTEKKKGFGKWINLMKPGNEEKDHWNWTSPIDKLDYYHDNPEMKDFLT
ncbi:hypothetical protein QJS10_CPB18g00471 [Acorus calamus]|uniref:Uncharacterized protein n=1 Tax=Acorus calamus TaxID=4465 RepID=A0AAV9CNC6_ACOCL|nr:hypothetical protein QJS10_CPB18g00471 [Acorus calamus]